MIQDQQQQTQTLLELCDDGFIFLNNRQEISDLNEQAARMLRMDAESLRGQAIKAISALSPVVGAVSNAKRDDVILNMESGRRILVSLRHAPQLDHIGLIQLCDLETFDYRRMKSSGDDNKAVFPGMSKNRTRPDFEVQRRLSPELNRVLSRGERAIRQGARVLITGETGVGKTEVARYLHSSISNANDPFVVVNCANASSSDLIGLLFGTGAGQSGLAQQALGGTLFLDEVAELPPPVQSRLLGFLENETFGPLNLAAGRAPNLNVISATNVNLRGRMKNGAFRSDLYFRLAIVDLNIPPLRQMPSLVTHLTDRFIVTINQRRTTPVILPERLRNVLEDYSFPGNIRELLNIVHKASIFMEDAEDMDELISELTEIVPVTERGASQSTSTPNLKAEVRRFERAVIDNAIRKYGSKRKAAKALGVDIGTISRKTAGPSTGGHEAQTDAPQTNHQHGEKK